MTFDDIERAAGFEIARDDLAPARYIGEPAQRALRGEDEIKLLVQHIWQIVDIGLNKASINANLCTQRTCQGNRLAGEIDAGDRRAQPCPGQRIHAEMALQMQ